MSNSSNWPIPVSGYDSLRIMTRRVDRMSRNASPISAADLLGPGMSSQAIHILDWNDEVATFNGFFYTTAGGLNAPVVQNDEGDDVTDLPWIGTAIAREDGTGTHQVWNTDDPSSMYFRTRNWAPNEVDPDGPPIYGDWQRFATRSGFIAEEDLHPDVRDSIDTALEEAEAGLHLALSVNKSYVQTTAPTNPDTDGRALVVNDSWFDSDDTKRPYRWDGSSWVDATTSWLVTNPSTAFPNVVISPAGLVAYNGAGVAVTTIDSSNGFLTTTGSIFSAADISGSTVTGGTVQSTATASRGVKINSSGLVGYSDGSNGVAAGLATIVIDATTGAITLRGAITSSATITGGSFATAGSGARAVVLNDRVRFYSSSGTNYAAVTAGAGSSPALVLTEGGGSSCFFDNTGFWSDNVYLDNLHAQSGSIEMLSSIDMNSNNITGVSTLSAFFVSAAGVTAAGSVNGATGAFSGDVTANSYYMSTSVASAGGNALFEGAVGLIRPNVAPSLSKWKRDITPLPVDLDSLAALGRGAIAFRYRDDVTLPFGVDDFDETFYGISLDLALELGGLDILVGNDQDGKPFQFLEKHLSISLLAGYGHDHERIDDIERRLQAAGL